MANFDPEKDIPDLAGKVIFVTGGTAGLGLQIVLLLAAHNPDHIIFTGRSQPRADTLLDTLKTKHPSLKTTFLQLDQTSLATITLAINSFLPTLPRLDILILNAGIMAVPASITTDGYEIQFGTNHVSHALILKLLLPTLLKTNLEPSSDVRVLFMTSLGAFMHPGCGIDIPNLKTPQSNLWPLGPWQRYGQSKLANILYPYHISLHPELISPRQVERQKEGKEILFMSFHPGEYNTDIVKNLSLGNKIFVHMTGGLKGEERMHEGAWSILWGAFTDREGGVIQNGGFYEPVGVVGRDVRKARDKVLAGQLWEWTEKELEKWN